MGAAKKLKKSKSPSVNYEALDQELAQKVQENLQGQLEQAFDGQGQNFVRLVLENVKNTNYDNAKLAIEAFVRSKNEYPRFEARITSVVEFSKDLIDSIEAKRNFPNMHLLSMTKQKEIMDLVLMHFNELKQALKSLERAGRDEHVMDLKSTHILIKTFTYMVGLFFAALFLTSFTSDLGQPFLALVESATVRMVDIVHSLLGL